MNFDQYEKKYESLYAEFSETVKIILEKAIAATDAENVPRPQAIQFRAKAAPHLKRKLEERSLLASNSIEAKIKDLAGARLIFYTNTDVDRFLNSRLIPDTFKVDWKETRIHHPTQENAQQRYQAIHYTVCLSPERSALPEYAKFAGLRCEIQIQTILNHAWAETSHDFLYHDILHKPPGSKGFGTKAFESVKKRMDRIMDAYLMPAGYEFAKAQHDIGRLMQGKELFDRGALDALAGCTDNNQRHETISTIKDYVIPNYDDIAGVYQELSASLLQAVVAALKTETVPIKSPFGDFPGKTEQDITALVINIFEEIRYVDVARTFGCLADLYKEKKDRDERKHILQVVERLAHFDLRVWQQVGPYVQSVLAHAVSQIAAADRAVLRPLVLTVWQELLGSELRGASFTADTVTISSGAVPPSDDLKAIRHKAINALIALYDEATSAGDKRQIVSSLMAATRLPSQAQHSSELCAIVINDTKRIFDLLAVRATGQPYDLLEHIEHEALFHYRRAREFVSLRDNKFGCKDAASNLMHSIVALRDLLNKDIQYVRYKTLVGYESVFPRSWEDDEFDYGEADKYRKQKAEEYIGAISAVNEDEWYALLEICAATKSNDMATLPVFGDFLQRLSKAKPDVALRFVKRADENILMFLPAFLSGLFESGREAEYRALIEGYLASGKYLGAVARHFHVIGAAPSDAVTKVLKKAMAVDDETAVIECLNLAIKEHDPQNNPLVENIFVPALKYLTDRKNACWLHGAWFLREAQVFFETLSGENATLVLSNMLMLPRVDYESERVLCYIAIKNPEAVWKYFGRRLHDAGDDMERYEAIPYQFHELNKRLAKNLDVAVDAVRAWYREDDPLFRFKGGRLLSAVFPTFHEPFVKKLSDMAANGSEEDMGFVLGILENYRGEVAIHPVLIELVNRLPEDDPKLSKVDICLQNTGVVSGEFGFVEAYRRKKAEMVSWADDARPRVKQFGAEYIRKLDERIAAEQRTAEQRKEMRIRDFDSDGAVGSG